jgi:membrane protease YdiL (CAAX protease family)
MGEAGLVPRLAIGPLAGAAVFLILTGGRIPLGRPIVLGRAVVVRWLALGVGASLEEAVWRGLVLGGLVAAIGPLGALALSSAGFAVWHRSLGWRCGIHLVTGAGFGIAFLAGGLAAAILAHSVYNVLVDWAVQAERAAPRGS